MEDCIPKKMKFITGKGIRLARDEGGPKVIKLICHDTTRIAVSWCENPVLVYLVQFTLATDFSKSTLNMTRNCSMVMSDLQPNSTYRVELRGIGKYGQIGDTLSSEFSTISRELQPAMVDSVTVRRIWTEDQELSAFASLNWSLSPDLPCQYELVLWKNQFGSYPVRSKVEFPEQEKLDETVLRDLEFETNYNVRVVASVSSEQESSSKWKFFKIPSCHKFYPGNLSMCRPSQPNAPILTEHLRASGDCELQLKWNPPVDLLELYNITVSQYGLLGKGDRQIFTIIIPGNHTEVSVPSLKPDTDVLLEIISVSPGGLSEKVRIYRQNVCSQQYFSFLYGSSLRNITARFAAGLTLFSFLVISIASLLLLYFKQKRKKKQLTKGYYFKQQIMKNRPLKNNNDNTRHAVSEMDEYEITDDALLICNVIGEGAFGVVHKGVLTKYGGTPEPVAVKMLRENATAEETRQFQKEIALMKTVGRHRNIVSLIGCCTQSCRLQLVVEFCALGDLQSYLRQEWKKQTEAITEDTLSTGTIKYADLTVDSFGSYTAPVTAKDNAVQGLVTNVMYDFLEKRKDNEKKTLAEHLLSFSWQIATGMEYLASNRVVHRDLAARNVLICDDQCVKISDFGLSRDIYEQNIYCKRSSEKMPVKWMALESLLHQIYTTQSDVWSFGILLWEIVTLGGNPYPSTPTNQMFRLLKQGFRMEQPPMCSNELYTIMKSCWKEKPCERPTFSILVGQLANLLESASPHQYLDLTHLGNYCGS
ncbi:tyrosine-protein kinase receptor torso isoform X2 [Homalodisca vitripennis]|uniref:tyrosine-protein kinase receptor torso isoform X2 n=1 Tax=Homalodisca vitripennis TaxID=197043 RepID=UPI001EEC6DAB|nr:tyrosine-protein kinase receptor torso isoform X2 [Homalodisca vitripennis]